MTDLPSLESRVPDTSDVVAAVKAALDGAVLALPLTEPPTADGPHLLSLYLRASSKRILLLAEPAGEPTNGRYPVRLSPSEAAGRASLEAFMEDVRKKADLPTAVAPAPVSTRSATSWAAAPAPASPPAQPAQPAPAPAAAPFAPQHKLPAGPRILNSAARPAATQSPSPAPPPVAPARLRPISATMPAVQAPSPTPSPRAKPAAIEGRTLGRFRVGRSIREGGKVYRGEHVGAGKTVAISVLRPAAARKITTFQREAAEASEIDHTNIVRTLGFGVENDGVLFTVTEFVAGMDLGTVLRDRAILPTARILSMMGQVCAGLGAAHERGVVHGHLHPDKILLVPARDDDDKPIEQVKVWGFGTPSEPLEDSRPYAAPERIRGAAADPRSDVFACGVILYQIATGAHPFGAGDSTSRPPKPPSAQNPAIDSNIEDVILIAMREDPATRYESARAMRSALRMISASPAPAPIAAPPPLLGEPAPLVAAAPAAAPAPPPTASLRPTAETPSARPPPPKAGYEDFPIPMSTQAVHRGDALDVDFSAVERRAAGAVELTDVRNQPPWVALELLTNALLRDPQLALEPLDHVTDLATYASEMQRMERPIATLGHRGETITLWKAICWLAMRARGVSPNGETREGIASQAIVAVLGDVETHAGVARVAIDTPGLKNEAARRILNAGGSVGASALLQARERADRSRAAAANRDERNRFVTALAEIGLAGVPAIVAFIRAQPTIAPVFLEELLDAMAAYVPPDGEGAASTRTTGPLDARAVAGAELVVALFAHSPVGVRRACAGAIAGLLGRHGNRQLVAIVKQEPEDSPRVAAIEALRRTGGIDRDMIFDFDALLSNAETSQPIRLAVAAALADAVPAVRPQAAGVIARALKTAGGGLLNKLVGSDTEDPALVVTMARTMLAIGGAEALSVVEARAARSGPDAKRQLLELIAAHGSSVRG